MRTPRTSMEDKETHSKRKQNIPQPWQWVVSGTAPASCLSSLSRATNSGSRSTWSVCSPAVTPRPPVSPVPVQYRHNLREYYNADIPSLYEGCCVWLLFIYLFTSHQVISLDCKYIKVGIDVSVHTQWQKSKWNFLYCTIQHISSQ